MTANPYINQYKKNQVETASPEQILILLYNAAINFLNKAKICLEEKNDEQFHHNMICCKNIIAEFMNTLDVEAGGTWAEVLFGLYKYLRKLVITSDISKNTVGIDEVLKHLTSLRDTWQKAIEIANEERKGSMMDEYRPSSSQNQGTQEFVYQEYADEDEDYDDDEDDEE